MIIREKYRIKIETAFRLVPIVVLIGARQVDESAVGRSFVAGLAPVYSGYFYHAEVVDG